MPEELLSIKGDPGDIPSWKMFSLAALGCPARAPAHGCRVVSPFAHRGLSYKGGTFSKVVAGGF